MNVEDHHKWRQHLAAQQTAQQAPCDELDDMLADPLIERAGRRRKQSEVAKTLAILDELERSGR